MDQVPKQLPEARPVAGGSDLMRHGSPAYGPGYTVALPRPTAEAAPGDLLGYWQLLRRRKRILSLITLLFGGAAALASYLQTPVFQGRALIEVQDINEDFMHMREMNPNAPRAPAPEYDIQTQVSVLTSAPLIERVAATVAGRRSSGWSATHTADTTRAALAVRARPNTRLIEILYDSADPVLAAEFVNTLVAEFIDQNVDARWQTTQHTAQRLTTQLEALKLKLERSESALQGYATANSLLLTQDRDTAAEDKVRQLQEELSKAQADRIAKESRYQLAKQAPPDSLSEVLEDTALKDSEIKLNDLRRTEAELTAVYTPSHPSVKKLHAQIAAVADSLERQRSNIVRRIQNDFESASYRQRLLEANYEVQFRKLSARAEKVARYYALKREVDTNRQLYDGLVQRANEAAIASAIRASNIRVVEPATQPEAPYKPRIPLNIALGLASGLFLGTVWVVVGARTDANIREPGDAASLLGVPELGVIPRSAEIPHARSRRLPGARTYPASLVRTEHVSPAIADAFRGIVMSLGVGTNRQTVPRVIVFTSAVPGEGKTTICSHVAAALAAINLRVLVIDADLRKPQMQRVFGVESGSALVDLLRSLNPVAGALDGATGRTGIPNLNVLTAGHTRSADLNLLFSERLLEVVHAARREYDVTLIDTPPMLMGDARVIAREADSVILVVRSNTPSEALARAFGQLQQDGANVLGTVLNDWRLPPSGHYRRYYDLYARRGQRHSG